jgi:hypothetical protein
MPEQNFSNSSKVEKIKNNLAENLYLYTAIITSLSAIFVENYSLENTNLDINLTFSSTVLVMLQLAKHFSSLLKSTNKLDTIDLEIQDLAPGEFEELFNLPAENIDDMIPNEVNSTDDEDLFKDTDEQSKDIIQDGSDIGKKIQRDILDFISDEENEDYENILDWNTPLESFSINIDQNNQQIRNLSEKDFRDAIKFLSTDFVEVVRERNVANTLSFYEKYPSLSNGLENQNVSHENPELHNLLVRSEILSRMSGFDPTFDDINAPDILKQVQKDILSEILGALGVGVTTSLFGTKVYKIAVDKLRQYFLFEVEYLEEDSESEKIIRKDSQQKFYTKEELVDFLTSTGFPKILGYSRLQELTNFEKSILEMD